MSYLKQEQDLINQVQSLINRNVRSKKLEFQFEASSKAGLIIWEHFSKFGYEVDISNNKVKIKIPESKVKKVSVHKPGSNPLLVSIGIITAAVMILWVIFHILSL